MFEKKNLVVNCDVCDARKVDEESLAGYERTVINADVILVDDRSRSILNKLPMVCNTDGMLSVEGEVSVINTNGNYEISGNTQLKDKTIICVNGTLSVRSGTEKVLENVVKIIVNGSARYPESMAPFMDRLQVNGTAHCIPDGCIELQSEFVIDKYFPLRARQDGKYYVEDKVVLTDADVDVEALAAKNIRFLTERFVVREEYIEKSVGMFEENVEMDVVPSGFGFVGEDAELSEALLQRYGKCLYIDGDLILKEDSESFFEQVEKILVNGDVRLLKRQETAFAKVNAVYKELVYVKGRYVQNQPHMVVDEALLESTPDGLEIKNCAILEVKKDAKPELILERLAVENCGKIFCSPEQKSVLQLVCKNVAKFSDKEKENDEEDEGIMGMIKKAVNSKVINADTYIL
ncbi:MAG: hypothetical protein HDQ96_06395 [Lachnospiraceae bacterium]|nr:hypothetical protein [Lachnospiraceae bacterium]